MSKRFFFGRDQQRNVDMQFWNDSRSLCDAATTQMTCHCSRVATLSAVLFFILWVNSKCAAGPGGLAFPCGPRAPDCSECPGGSVDPLIACNPSASALTSLCSPGFPGDPVDLIGSSGRFDPGLPSMPGRPIVTVFPRRHDVFQGRPTHAVPDAQELLGFRYLLIYLLRPGDPAYPRSPTPPFSPGLPSVPGVPRGPRGPECSAEPCP